MTTATSVPPDAVENLRALQDFLVARIKAKGWSEREAARRADISAGGIWQVLHGNYRPQADTLKKLAGALGISEARVLHMGGFLDEVENRTLEPNAAYIARRLTDLPQGLQEEAIRAVEGMVDAFYNIQAPHHVLDGEAVPHKLSEVDEVSGRSAEERYRDAVDAYLVAKAEQGDEEAAQLLKALRGQVVSQDDNV